MTRIRRSLLEVPGNVERMVEKSRSFDVDVLMLDLEDSVPATEEAKRMARRVLSTAIPAGGFRAREVGLRLNTPSSQWFADDIRFATGVGVGTVILPKVQSADEVVGASRALRAGGQSPEIILIVETPGLLTDLSKLVEPDLGITGLISGGFDYTLEIGSMALLSAESRMDDSHLMLNRQLVLAFARRMGWSALDGLLVANPKDFDEARGAARRSRAQGFDGCALYYPPHCEIVHEVFAPTAEELAWADAVLAAHWTSGQLGRAAVTVDGRVVLPQHMKVATRLRDYATALSGRAFG